VCETALDAEFVRQCSSAATGGNPKARTLRLDLALLVGRSSIETVGNLHPERLRSDHEPTGIVRHPAPDEQARPLVV
jgi:hypothetical protein